MKLNNKQALEKYIAQQAVRIEKALIYLLEYTVAKLETHAKMSAGYIDQTGNLKSSIGGAVLKDGKVITYKGLTSGTLEGNVEGKQFIDKLIEKFTKGYVILVVAGMEYATYVENSHNLNVLKKSELKMLSELPVSLEKLRKKISENAK